MYVTLKFSLIHLKSSFFDVEDDVLRTMLIKFKLLSLINKWEFAKVKLEKSQIYKWKYVNQRIELYLNYFKLNH